MEVLKAKAKAKPPTTKFRIFIELPSFKSVHYIARLQFTPNPRIWFRGRPNLLV